MICINPVKGLKGKAIEHASIDTARPKKVIHPSLAN
jgi:hypothetical protein